MNRNLQTCAWSKDGKSLANAVEDSLCIFSWTDLTKPNNFTFAHWNSLEVTGKINCIASWKTSSFIIVTELPLDKLCGYCKFENDTDFFEVQNGSDSSDEGKGKESNSSAVLTQDTNLSILTPSADQDSLLKLNLRPPQYETSETLAQIIAICCEDLKPREVGRSSIKGLLSPDLLLFQVCIMMHLCCLSGYTAAGVSLSFCAGGRFFSRAFLVFLMKESKKRRLKQPGKLMAESRSQPVNLPGARPLMNLLLQYKYVYVQLNFN